MITFFDGSQRRVLLDFFHQCPLLREPIIFKDVKKFDRIISTYIGDALRNKNVDTKIELIEYINEVKSYNLKPSDKQLADVSIVSGFVESMNEIIRFDYAYNKTCCFKGKKKQKLINFAVSWLEYIKLLSIKYNDPSYETITHQMIYQQITDKQLMDMIHLNFVYSNIIYDYCLWFKNAVIKNDMAEMEIFVMNNAGQILDNIISGNIKLDVSQLGKIIDTLLRGSGKLSNQQKDILNSQLFQINACKQLLLVVQLVMINIINNV